MIKTIFIIIGVLVVFYVLYKMFLKPSPVPSAPRGLYDKRLVGSWIAVDPKNPTKITFYEDSGVNHTNYFVGYNFTFNSSNVLTASNGTNTYTGSWSVTSSNSNDDNPSNDLDFNILFTSPANFADELSDDDFNNFPMDELSKL